MTGLSKITDKIKNEAMAEAQEKLAQADAECASVAADYQRRAEQIRQTINADAKREAEEIVARAKSGMETVRRNELLQTKGQQIDAAFQRAKKEILDLSEERYLAFLTTLLVATVKRQIEDEKASLELYGEEDAPVAERYEVLLGRRDAARCGEALLAGARKALEGEVDKDALSKLVLAPEEANIDGGLILRCGNMEINNSLSALFAQVRPQMEAKVGQKLFPTK